MFKIGRTIFYDKKTGILLHDTGEIQTTMSDFTDLVDYYSTVKALKERDPETVAELRMDYGQYADDYDAGGYVDRIDLDTEEPLFVYPPDSGETEPSVPQLSLSERLARAEAENAENRNSIMELTMLLAAGV